MEDENTLISEGVTLLEKCPKDQIEKFVHEVLDGICNSRDPRYMTYGKVWTTGEWQLVTQQVCELLKSFVRKYIKKNEIVQELDKYSLGADTKQTLCSCFMSREDEVRAAVINSTAGISNAYLRDFDWKVKMVLASDKIASIRKPIISIDFDIKQGSTVKPVTVEMTKEELQDLITSLEAVNKMVVQLKG